MAELDLSKYTAAELDAFVEQAKKLGEQRKQEEVMTLYRDIEALAKAGGYTLDELIATARNKTKGKRKQKSNTAIAARYHNPEDHSQTWSGRGKPPTWLAEKIAQGATKETFLIDQAS